MAGDGVVSVSVGAVQLWAHVQISFVPGRKGLHAPPETEKAALFENQVNQLRKTFEEEMSLQGVDQLPVVSDGQVKGILSRESVVNFLRNLQELNRSRL